MSISRGHNNGGLPHHLQRQGVCPPQGRAPVPCRIDRLPSMGSFPRQESICLHQLQMCCRQGQGGMRRSHLIPSQHICSRYIRLCLTREHVLPTWGACPSRDKWCPDACVV